MARSGSQKALLVIGVINIVVAICTILMGIFMIFAGGLYATSPDATAVNGMSAEQAGWFFSAAGVASVIEALIELVMGILGVRASNDSSKVMPLWVISLVGLVCACLSAIMTIASGSISASTIGEIIGSIAGSGLMFWTTNNVKKQSGR